MKNFVKRLFATETPPAVKSRPRAPFVALHDPGRGIFGERAGAGLVKAGFHRNAVAYRCVRLIAEAAASVPLTLTANGRETKAHAFDRLLARPNPRENGTELFEALYGHLLLSGNAYCEVLAQDGEVQELYALRPDRMRLVAGADGWPEAYDYTCNGRVRRIRLEAGESGPLLHLKLFDPLDDHYGYAPLAAAQVSLEMHEAASRWNKALLDNSARPSGALVYASAENLSDNQFNRLKGELEQAFQGSGNAGRPILLEGGLEWRPLSLSPKDMDFQEARNGAAREIALAFGVPPLLLGLPGDNTHANYAEANRAFWRSTILPLVRRTMNGMSQWLQPYAAQEIRIEPDLDQIEALSGEREALWRRVSAADYLTEDEKRAAIGYGRRAFGEKLAAASEEAKAAPDRA